MNRLLLFSLYFFRRRSNKQQQGKVREMEKKMEAIYGLDPGNEMEKRWSLTMRRRRGGA